MLKVRADTRVPWEWCPQHDRDRGITKVPHTVKCFRLIIVNPLSVFYPPREGTEISSRCDLLCHYLRSKRVLLGLSEAWCSY